jgi:carbonic anhydrase/acetyltransferase-like protein (isoleucine patch superfamily)
MQRLVSRFSASLVARWSQLRTHAFTWMVSGLVAESGSGTRVVPPLRFGNLHQVKLGKGVIINRDCWIIVIGGLGDDRSIKLDIGANAGIGMGATISAAKSVVIEEWAVLARNVYISDHGHAFEDVSRPISVQGITEPAPVRIGRATWLGQNAVVLPGVTIGEHCIIGANSVVKSSIPPYSVAVGSPARVVKQFNPTTQRWEKVNSKPLATSR